MLVFLSTFLLIYLGMHVYIYWGVRRAFPETRRYYPVLLGLVAVLCLSPIIARVLEHRGAHGPSLALAFVGNTWLAVALWLFLLSALLDLWNLAAWALSKVCARARRLAVPRSLGMKVIGVLIVAATVWAYCEAASVRLKQIVIRTPHMPAGSEPLRILQVSDLHLGTLVGEKHLGRTLALVRQARPDVLVSTGDLLDASFVPLQREAEMLAAVDVPLGSFAVLGNHEFYVGAVRSLEFHEAAGLRVLRGESVVVDGRLIIAGTDGSRGHGREPNKDQAEEHTLPAGKERLPVVLLKHFPQVRPESVGHFDVQLSGHTHDAQLWPLGYLATWVNGFSPGLHDLGKGSSLYVSRGAGTWGPPMRFLAPPDVTLVILMPAE